MKILIIGNGFDLAHGLPTKYVDFLGFCKNRKNRIDSNDCDKSAENSDFLENNIWLNFFLTITPDLNNNMTWIDFEKEIAAILRAFDNAGFSVKEFIISDIDASGATTPTSSNSSIFFYNPDSSDFDDVNYFLSSVSYFPKRQSTSSYAVEVNGITDSISLIAFFYQQLKAFMREFEIYCLNINDINVSSILATDRKEQIINARNKEINTMPTAQQLRDSYRVGKLESEAREAAYLAKFSSPDIKLIDYRELPKFDCVLSFNYTNTFERLYDQNKQTKYCYIHGKAQEDATKTNIVFGIDDNLENGEENKNFTFVRFKKYFQRIIFKTGAEYRDWLKPHQNNMQTDCQNNMQTDCEVFIVGHSLDKTDFDVLHEIFSKDHIKITIYYCCPADFEDKVLKVIRLLAWKGGNGRDELIRRVHGNDWSIRFVDQYDENDGLFLCRVDAGGKY
jgi:hypothetical protein